MNRYQNETDIKDEDKWNDRVNSENDDIKR